MKHNYIAKYNNLLLRQIEDSDIELLRKWRNNKAITKFLRPIDEITPQMQEIWYREYLKNDHELAMAIFECNELNSVIGSISLYDFNGAQAEFGKFMIGDERAHRKGFGRKSLVMLLKLGFEELALGKIIAWVHKDNIAAYKVYLKIGCRIVDERVSCVGGVEYKIEIDKETLIRKNNFYNDIELIGISNA